MAVEDKEKSIFLAISSTEDLRPKYPYLKNIVFMSSVINMWPKKENTNAFAYHFGVWMVITGCTSFLFSYAIQIRKDFNNMDSITALIDFLTVFISGTFRYIYIYTRGDKYLHLVHLVHNNFIHYSIFPRKSRPCLDKYYKMASKLVVAYGTFTFFWILQVCLMPIVSYSWTKSKLTLNDTMAEQIPYPIPMKTYAPFDYYQQPGNALFYSYQVCGFILFGWIYVMVDSFWYTTILLTIGQFVLIKESLTTIMEVLNRDNQAEEFRLLEANEIRKVEEALKSCVKHHQFLRKFVRLLDDISNPNIFVDSLHAVISIGFILLDATIALNTADWNKVMYSLEYFATSIIHIFFFAWLGNELAIKEEELAEVVYKIPWYKCPSQKPAFVLMMCLSRRPYRLTGGKMYKLSLEFFTSTMKAVFSYFTFLFQLRNNKPN